MHTHAQQYVFSQRASLHCTLCRSFVSAVAQHVAFQSAHCSLAERDESAPNAAAPIAARRGALHCYCHNHSHCPCCSLNDAARPRTRAARTSSADAARCSHTMNEDAGRQRPASQSESAEEGPPKGTVAENDSSSSYSRSHSQMSSNSSGSSVAPTPSQSLQTASATEQSETPLASPAPTASTASVSSNSAEQSAGKKLVPTTSATSLLLPQISSVDPRLLPTPKKRKNIFHNVRLALSVATFCFASLLTFPLPLRRLLSDRIDRDAATSARFSKNQPVTNASCAVS